MEIISPVERRRFNSLIGSPFSGIISVSNYFSIKADKLFIFLKPGFSTMKVNDSVALDVSWKYNMLSLTPSEPVLSQRLSFMSTGSVHNDLYRSAAGV